MTKNNVKNESSNEQGLTNFQLMILTVSVISDPICITIVLPFVPFLIQDFFKFPPEAENQIGYYAGMIASSYTFAQVLSSSFWCALSDRVGRKPILLFGMICNIVFITLFGLAPNFQLCLAARFCQGLLNSNLAVAKCYLADITTTSNEENKGFVIIGIAFGFGSIIGPIIGGYLSEPASKYPSVFSSTGLFAQKPYFLPCLCVAVYVAVDLVFTIFFLPESKIQQRIVVESVVGSTQEIEEGRSKRGNYGACESSPGGEEEDSIPLLHSSNGEEEGVLSRLMACPEYVKALQLGTLHGMVFMAFNEVLPVWARGDTSVGGVHFSTSDIGTVLAVGGAACLVTAFTLFPRLADRFGVLVALRVGLCAAMVGWSVPLWLSFVGWGPQQERTWMSLIVGASIWSFAAPFVFTSRDIIIKNSVPADTVGTAMGIAASVMKLGYAVGPVLGGSIFAWSSRPQNVSHLPFMLCEGRLFFVVMEIGVLVGLYMSFRFPKWPWERPV